MRSKTLIGLLSCLDVAPAAAAAAAAAAASLASELIRLSAKPFTAPYRLAVIPASLPAACSRLRDNIHRMK